MYKLQNANSGVSKEPSLYGEATECRLCKHCGCSTQVSKNGKHLPSSAVSTAQSARENDDANIDFSSQDDVSAT